MTSTLEVVIGTRRLRHLVVLVCLVLLGCGSGSAGPAPDLQTEPVGRGFDEVDARARADELLGLHEDHVEELEDVRVVRRGRHEPAQSADHVPGRMNVTLEDREGRVVVTRVAIEANEPGERSIIVEQDE